MQFGSHKRKLAVSAVVVVALHGPVVLAQDIGDTSGSESAPTDSNAAPITVTDSQGNTINVTGSVAPPTTQSTTVQSVPYGFPQPGFNPDAHLPSSSRSLTDINNSTDGFDLLPGHSGGGVVRGDKNAPAVLAPKSGSSVPALYQVKRGDTLWDLCATYFNNPWLWPKVWSYNPQIQNPHWIYPGDQVRLRTDVPLNQAASLSLGNEGEANRQGQGGFLDRRPQVPKQTIFLRNQGYIDDPSRDVWGELIGAKEEQMLLAQGNHAYMKLRPGVDARIGQQLTVFTPIRTPRNVSGARQPDGEIVAFKGTVEIDHWNPETRIARGRIIESLDAIERGAKVGPVGRRFEVVPPVRNDVDVWARVLTSLYPHELYGQNQVAFIDKGSKDGLEAGNRLFVVQRGDAWRRTLATTTKMARGRVRTDVPEAVKVEYTPLHGDTEDFPEEIIGELRVIRTHEQASLVLVVGSEKEIEPGDRAVARKGY